MASLKRGLSLVTHNFRLHQFHLMPEDISTFAVASTFLILLAIMSSKSHIPSSTVGSFVRTRDDAAREEVEEMLQQHDGDIMRMANSDSELRQMFQRDWTNNDGWKGTLGKLEKNGTLGCMLTRKGKLCRIHEEDAPRLELMSTQEDDESFGPVWMIAVMLRGTHTSGRENNVVIVRGGRGKTIVGAWRAFQHKVNLWAGEGLQELGKMHQCEGKGVNEIAETKGNM